MNADDSPKERKKSWIQKLPRPTSSHSTRSNSGGNGGLSFGKSNGSNVRPNHSGFVNLATTKEGEELSTFSRPANGHSQLADQTGSSKSTPSSSKASSIIRNSSFDSPPVSRPTTPIGKRWSLLTNPTPQRDLDTQTSNLAIEDLERYDSNSRASTKAHDNQRHSSSFGKSLTSMMGGLSSLSLSRTSTRDSTYDSDHRGRSMFSGRRSQKSASQAPPDSSEPVPRSRSRARSQSPFFLRKWRTRDSSPPERLPLSQSDAELSEAESTVQRTAFTYDSGDDGAGDTSDNDSEDDSDIDVLDSITERNTEQNAIIAPIPTDTVHEGEDFDPVGEGVNVVVAPEPYFPTSLNALGTSARNKRNPRRRKSVKTHEPLPLHTSRPVFQRDRCTITITQGDPDAKVGEVSRKKRRYVVGSDLSEESRYAVEWGIGTVLRDGDEMFLVNVVENEARVDPPSGAGDRAAKLKSQQERQGMAYILARQVTGLLQRTRLNVTVSCQAWHAKNARHMLLDIVDYLEPTMLIVGSRGLSHLNGILLGSTSHYLVEKCSVPVMVARRRLKRPPRKAAHLSTSRTHVKLAEAGIDRVAGRVDETVNAMRDELHKEDQRRQGGPGSRDGLRDFSAPDYVPEEDENEGDNEEEEDHQITLVGP